MADYSNASLYCVMNTRKQLRSFCYFCGEHVAVTNGYLADHGFRVPGFGHRTTGCPGSNMTPNELTTKQIEKSIKMNQRFIDEKDTVIANIIASSLKPYEKNTAVAKAERNAEVAAINIATDREALAQWTAKELLEVDLIQEANDKKSEVTNTRRASLEAKLAKVPARKERALKNFEKALKTWANSGNAEVDARMTESCKKDYEYELRRIDFDVNEWTTKLGMLK